METMSPYQFQTTIKRINGDSITPISMFNRLQGEKKFFLESNRLPNEQQSYTYIGVNPVKSYTAKDDSVTEWDASTNSQKRYVGDIFRILKAIVPEPITQTEFSFVGGLLGYVSFHGTVELEQRDTSTVPQYQFDLYESIVIYDHRREEIILIHNSLSLRLAEEVFAELIEQITSQEKLEEPAYELSGFKSDVTDAAYCDLIREAKQQIVSGRAMQLVISRRFQADFAGDAFRLYRKLRKETQAPYMYFVQYEDFSLIGASPEGIFSIKGNEINVDLVTGARPRGNNAREDLQVELSLLQNAKEISSHNLLVDMTTKDLEGICLDGSVQLIDYMKPMQFKHSIRLATEIRGELHPLTHPVDVLSKLLPSATVTGVPKALAAQLVCDIEPVARSYYGGALGFFSLNGYVNFTLLQQSMIVRENKAYIQAGANILSDTTEMDAIIETRKKIKAFLLIDNK